MKQSIVVLSRDGKYKGHYTGGTRKCRMEGCRGMCRGIRWNDGKLTFPCGTGIVEHSKMKHQTE